jgi:putative peptide maturation dehydrogenase
LSRVRRTRYVAFVCRDERALDIGRLLQGEPPVTRVPQPFALSALTGDRFELTREELNLALSVPDEWMSRDEFLGEGNEEDAVRLDRLARGGVVVSDDPDPELTELRRRDESLTADHWSAPAAIYHFGTKWRDIRVALEQTGELERLGMPPPHFVTLPKPADVLALDRHPRAGQLYEALLRRRTSRGFDRRTPVTIDQLATVLGSVWGAHGLVEFSEGVAMLRKSSPSGGGLHPIEVYPLVRDVEGVEPGLYHYSVRDHTLELISAVEESEVEELAFDFTAGQPYFQAAHVLFLMTGRFDRSFWKYRDHPRAYAVLLMDAGHLSQTFYLVCTELGLGAFVTAAINGANVEEALGIDGFREGAIAICGCGPPGPAPSGLEPQFAPYPR